METLIQTTTPPGLGNPEHDEKRLDPLCRAVRSLREAMGETQQQFATRLHIAISTAVRYERSRPPRGEALATFLNLAVTIGESEIAEVFRGALSGQLGYQVNLPGSGDQCGLPAIPDEAVEIEYLKLILRAAHVGLPGFEEQRAAWQRLRQPSAEDGIKRATIRALIMGLYEEILKRMARGESDQTIIAAATADPETVRRLLVRLRQSGGVPGINRVGVDQEFVSELLRTSGV